MTDIGVECLCDAHGKHRLLDCFACGLIITSCVLIIKSCNLISTSLFAGLNSRKIFLLERIVEEAFLLLGSIRQQVKNSYYQ